MFSKPKECIQDASEYYLGFVQYDSMFPHQKKKPLLKRGCALSFCEWCSIDVADFFFED